MTYSTSDVMLIFPFTLAVFDLISRRAETGSGNESPFLGFCSPRLEPLDHNKKSYII